MNFVPRKISPDLDHGKASFKSPALFTFFAGAGFLDLGFEKNGFDVVFVNEFHSAFLKAYQFAREQMKIAPPKFGYVLDDIKSLLGAEESIKLQDYVSQARASHGVVGFVGGRHALTSRWEEKTVERMEKTAFCRKYTSI